MPRGTIQGLVMAGAAALGGSASAQMTIPWSTIDGGGGQSSGGAFTMSATIGQAEAGGAMQGGVGGPSTFTVSGGFWTAHACAADFNGVNGITVQDIFDFLAAWFAANPNADFNHVNGINVQDVFDFLAAWFVGC